MTEQNPSSTLSAAKTVRIIHAAISVGIATLFGVFLFLRTGGSTDLSGQVAGILKWVAYVGLAASLVASYGVRGRIPVPPSGTDLDQWWKANQPKAVVSWAIAESGGLLAIVVGWLTASTTLMALGAGAALALLFVSRPGALEGAA
jgi:hypothetical protein